MDLNRISTCSYPVRTQPLERILQLVADAGYRKLDLWGGPPNYSTNPDECDIRALKAAADQAGIRIANLGTYPGRKLHEVGYEAEMREMTRAIDHAAFLGSRSIRVCPGHGEDPTILPDLIPFFRESARYAAAKGVFLGMENHRGSLAGNPEAILPLLDAVPSPSFGILFEPANLMACRVDYKDAYHRFRGRIVHVHVKDSRWIDDVYERTDLGEGDVDLPWLVHTLEADGYEGDYALEFEIEKRIPVEEGLPAWLATFRAVE